MIKCNPGNKPCGKRCVPHEHKCAEHGEKLKRDIGYTEDGPTGTNRKINPFVEIFNIPKIAKAALPGNIEKEDLQDGENNIYSVGDLKPGSVIRNYFKGGKHYGVYLGEGKIAHIKTGVKLPPDGKQIFRPHHVVVESFESAHLSMQSKWEVDTEAGGETRSVDEIMEILDQIVDKPVKYSTLYGNCEHFARALVEKKAYSKQQQTVGKFFSPIIDFSSNKGIDKIVGMNRQGLDVNELANFTEGSGQGLDIVGPTIEMLSNIEKGDLSDEEQLQLVTSILKGQLAILWEADNAGKV